MSTFPHGSVLDEPLVEIRCLDGVRLAGHLWRSRDVVTKATIIINAATGVLARYYHRYARFLAEHGFDVLTYDYRGIGLSRPDSLRGCGYRWHDWGERDVEAALRFVGERRRGGPLIVVGHSIGGFLPGLAESAPAIDRMLTVGAQYAWWGDYRRPGRLRLFAKWHLAMPMLTAACGYFPGRRLGWLEDLPAGVAYEWSFRGSRFERGLPVAERRSAIDRLAAVTAPILAVAIADDELGTLSAVRRALSYYKGAAGTVTLLTPSDYGREAIGHFGLFHARHAGDFWLQTLDWLRDGRNPWDRPAGGRADGRPHITSRTTTASALDPTQPPPSSCSGSGRYRAS